MKSSPRPPSPHFRRKQTTRQFRLSQKGRFLRETGAEGRDRGRSRPCEDVTHQPGYYRFQCCRPSTRALGDLDTSDALVRVEVLRVSSVPPSSRRAHASSGLAHAGDRPLGRRAVEPSSLAHVERRALRASSAGPRPCRRAASSRRHLSSSYKPAGGLDPRRNCRAARNREASPQPSHGPPPALADAGSSVAQAHRRPWRDTALPFAHRTYSENLNV